MLLKKNFEILCQNKFLSGNKIIYQKSDFEIEFMKEVKESFIQRVFTRLKMSILVKKSKESYALTPSTPIQATTSSIQDIYFKAGLTSYCEASVLNNQF